MNYSSDQPIYLLSLCKYFISECVTCIILTLDVSCQPSCSCHTFAYYMVYNCIFFLDFDSEMVALDNTDLLSPYIYVGPQIGIFVIRNFYRRPLMCSQ